MQECLDRCCNATTCQLVASAACRAGECCLPNCLFVPYGTTCRNVSRECDIAEYCTGDSADCPKDVYLQDLTFCNDNESYCFSGSCNTRDKQCMEHFKTGKIIIIFIIEISNFSYTKYNTKFICFQTRQVI